MTSENSFLVLVHYRGSIKKKHEIPGEPVGFGAIDTQDTGGLVGQQFQNKKEAVLSVKTYSIR
ncbi:hypothetical protein Ahy_B03g066838 [Arachis hypogaea]|uniref:Uncharacterized protein n=1 Tax=Arachis hypogaea TaxID=3818 RepID=A0A445A502_ARAHY|nr:hypothetical protein Ahy_B03g066838 [Arachis hypogaea]